MRDDRASATLAAGIIGMLFLCLCMGMAIDTAKNGYLRIRSLLVHSIPVKSRRKTLTPRVPSLPALHTPLWNSTQMESVRKMNQKHGREFVPTARSRIGKVSKRITPCHILSSRTTPNDVQVIIRRWYMFPKAAKIQYWSKGTITHARSTRFWMPRYTIPALTS